MLRLRRNFIEGTLGTSVSDSTTTLASLGFTALPEIVTGTDIMAITIDPGPDGAREIVWITAHDTAASTVTVERGQEGTTAVGHDIDTPWVHAATRNDYDNGGHLTHAPRNHQTGSSYTIVQADSGGIVDFERSTDTDVTVPQLEAGSVVEVFQGGTGKIEAVAGSGVTLRAPAGTVTAGQYAAMLLWWRTATEVIVSGNVEA